jgi:hypothetical protein
VYLEFLQLVTLLTRDIAKQSQQRAWVAKQQLTQKDGWKISIEVQIDRITHFPYPYWSKHG